MKKIFNYILSATLIFTLASCNEDEVLSSWVDQNPEVDTTPTGEAGTADLSNLVVLGTSLASGFQDGALHDAGQANSFPALLGGQFQIGTIGGTTDFGQPDINSANGYNMLANDGSGRSELSLSLLAPVNTTGDLLSILTPWSGTTNTLNNFGVPLTQSGQLVIAATGGPVTDTYGGAVPAAGNPAYNPFYKRFASSPSADGATGSTPLTDALGAGGSFFVYEAGINDVALYAAGGGTTAIGPITNPAVFEGAADAAIHALATTGGTNAYEIEGVVLNVPPILVFPFFQAVKYNAIPLDAATAGALNSGLAAVNGAIQALVDNVGLDQADADKRFMSYAEGQNAILVIDESLTDLGPLFDLLGLPAANRAGLVPYEQSRPLTADDIVPLGTAPILGVEADGDDTVADTPYGLVIPLGFSLATGIQPGGGDPFYIDGAEQVEIETNRAMYNAALAGAVADVNAAGGDVVLVDIESIFLDAAGFDGVTGIEAQGLTLAPDFSPNGIFSTDGIHPCQRGHGLIANKIISAINAQWGASVPEVNIAGLPGPVFIP